MRVKPTFSINRFIINILRTLFAGLALVSQAAQSQLQPPEGRFGLLPASGFRATTGSCADCAVLPQALWYFRKDVIAVPKPGLPVAGYDRAVDTRTDIASWNETAPLGAAPDYPSLVWIGAPSLLHSQGMGAMSLVPKIELNRSYFDASSAAYFNLRKVRARGSEASGAFVARTLWPEDFNLSAVSDVATPTSPADIRALVRRDADGGAKGPFAVESLWRRSAAPAESRAGKSAIGIILNGAQGDDDEAHAGHFAFATGRVGDGGEIADWLVANFYSLDSVSEKGIVGAMVPLDNYFADLNSGQAWYRPSYMLVAILKSDRAAAHLQSALARVFNQFYRHQFVYQHASANCSGTSISTARAVGWKVPQAGPAGWVKASIALPVGAVATGSLSKGKAMFDYLTEDRTRLFPAVAFEQAGADLIALGSGKAGRELSPLERALAEDIEELLLVRLPQLPSSRKFGSWPIASGDEYIKRVPRDPEQRQFVPVGPREFPEMLRDDMTPPLKPQRSDYAVVVLGMFLLAMAVLALRWAIARWRGRAGQGSR